MRALISLVELRGGNNELIKTLNQFSEQVGKLARRRNRFVHDPWIVAKATGEARRFEITADKKLVYKLHDLDPDEMDALVSDIDAAFEEMFQIYKRILNELPQWPRKQFLESSRGIFADV
jgi:hypothetical protein